MTALLLLACVEGPGEAALVPVDTGAFFAEVEPVLVERCANPSCHGTAERPLEVYAVHRNRMDPDDVWLDGGLTAEERAANLARARGFVGPTLELARKSLDPDAGGMRHGGGAIYADATDAEYATLRDWAEGI